MKNQLNRKKLTKNQHILLVLIAWYLTVYFLGGFIGLLSFYLQYELNFSHFSWLLISIALWILALIVIFALDKEFLHLLKTDKVFRLRFISGATIVFAILYFL